MPFPSNTMSIEHGTIFVRIFCRHAGLPLLPDVRSVVLCRCLHVDEINKLLLAATADKCATVFDLTAGLPLAR